MRNGKTHFEQVPIEVVNTVVRQAAALPGMLGKSPALVSELEAPSCSGISNARRESTPVQRAAYDEDDLGRIRAQ
jgi:hypothetical protein